MAGDAGRGNEESGLTARSGIVVLITVIVIVLDLLNFGNYWLGRYVAQGNWGSPDTYIASEVWPQFKEEAIYYQEKNITPVTAALSWYDSVVDRSRLGYSAPLLDFLFLKLIRALAFFVFFLAGGIIILFIAVEALKRGRDKFLNFEHRSSTIYHVTLNAGLFTAGSVFFIYLFMPGTIFIPTILTMDVPAVFFRPHLWTMLLTATSGGIVYIMLSNLSYKS